MKLEVGNLFAITGTSYYGTKLIKGIVQEQRIIFNFCCNFLSTFFSFLAGKPGYRAQLVAEDRGGQDDDQGANDEEDGREDPVRDLPVEEDVQGPRDVPVDEDPHGQRVLTADEEDPQVRGVLPADEEDPQVQEVLPAEEDQDRDRRKRARCCACYTSAATRQAKQNVAKVRGFYLL